MSSFLQATKENDLFVQLGKYMVLNSYLLFSKVYRKNKKNSCVQENFLFRMTTAPGECLECSLNLCGAA